VNIINIRIVDGTLLRQENSLTLYCRAKELETADNRRAKGRNKDNIK
jgi:hypothetical protein